MRLSSLLWAISAHFPIVIFQFLILTLTGCKNDVNEQTSVKPAPYVFADLDQFPKKLNIPDFNPTTVEGVRLGRFLFYDGRISGRLDSDSLMSCASCHVQERGFKCGLDHPIYKGHPFGLPSVDFPHGTLTPHVMLSLINTVYNSNGYLWNGGAQTIESIVAAVITDPHEINGSVDKTVYLIASDPMYRPMFKAAFGSEEVNINRISNAIAQFVRTIIAYRFKFYDYVQHKASLTPAELKGYEMFYSEKADCFHCHAGSLLMTTTNYYNNAKDTVFSDPLDRYSVTGNTEDKGAYRAPSLINCELNAPYMHDGRFITLDEVIDFYSEGLKYSDNVSPMMTYVRNGGNHLSPEEKAELKSFLLTLTDHALLTDSTYSCPEALGTWGIKPPAY